MDSTGAGARKTSTDSSEPETLRIDTGEQRTLPRRDSDDEPGPLSPDEVETVNLAARLTPKADDHSPETTAVIDVDQATTERIKAADRPARVQEDA